MARLIDPQAGRFVDLNTSATYTLTSSPQSGTDRIVVAVGTGKFVEQVTSRETAQQLYFALGPVAPNPGRSNVSFRFNLTGDAQARLQLYDVSGRVVRQLADTKFQGGQHLVPWDGRRDDGGLASSGVYYLKLSAAGRQQTRRFAYVR